MPQLHSLSRLLEGNPQNIPKDFTTQFIAGYTLSGMDWVQTVGCIWAIVGYLVSNRRRLWNVLLLHSICGLLGTAIENYFEAKQQCCGIHNSRWLLLLNEINWILHESTTVVFSLVKLETVLFNDNLKSVFRIVLAGLLAVFSGLRFYIGILRMEIQDIGRENRDILRAHSYAYIFLGMAELVLFGLLIHSTIHHLKVSRVEIRELIATLFKSSIPRIFIILVNTLLITIVGQIHYPSLAVENLSDVVWAIKGSYPMILLFDLQSTKNMLLMATTNTMDHADDYAFPSKKSETESYQ